MADAWQTFNLDFNGGLVTNLNELQQGLTAPGSARILKNFEPSVEGGYRKIKGYSKYDSNAISNSGLIRGLAIYGDDVYAVRGPHLYKSSGSGWTQVTSSDYIGGGATANTDGAVSNSTAVTLTSNVGTIAVGMQVTGTGISGTVKVSTVISQTSLVLDTAVTIADATTLTFTSEEKVRFTKYNMGAGEKLCIVDSVGKPFTYDGTTLTLLSNAPTDYTGCEKVVIFKNHLFFSSGSKLLYTAPYLDDNLSDTFSFASGGGVHEIGDVITDLIVFRERLIIFGKKTIKQYLGSSQSDFTLQSITEDLGALEKDTVQEVGGDVVFLGPDGLRLLGATERIGDFSLAVISKVIQKESTNFYQATPAITSFSSVVIRNKSQYRIFRHKVGDASLNSRGLIATQATGQQQGAVLWGETRGIHAFVSVSELVNNLEKIYFANDDGYVYELESGNSFDGSNIKAEYRSPQVPLNDARIRKSYYKGYLYTAQGGALNINLNLILDFSEQSTNLIQPTTLALTNNVTGTFAFYGNINSTYGNVTYSDGSSLSPIKTQLIGSSYTVAFEIISDNTEPDFNLEALSIEYATHDRR
jgi:hypothetical protein